MAASSPARGVVSHSWAYNDSQAGGMYDVVIGIGLACCGRPNRLFQLHHASLAAADGLCPPAQLLLNNLPALVPVSCAVVGLGPAGE